MYYARVSVTNHGLERTDHVPLHVGGLPPVFRTRIDEIQLGGYKISAIIERKLFLPVDTFAVSQNRYMV